MKNLILLVSLVFVIGLTSHSQTIDSVFISEFHYDNIGGDTLEGFEISGLAGTNLSCYTVYFFNGANGLVYNQVSLQGIIPNQLCDFGALWFNLASIQNSNEAIALYNNCTNSKIQFLSYEGSLIANEGPFSGDTSFLISVLESNSALGSSLQFLGVNSDLIDSLWVGPMPHSIGLVNSLIPPCTFSVVLSDPLIETECQPFGFQELSVLLTNTSNTALDTFIISCSFQDSVFSDSIFQTILPDSVMEYSFQDSILFLIEEDFSFSCWVDAINDGQAYSDTSFFDGVFTEFDSLILSNFVFDLCVGDTISLLASDFNGIYFSDTSSFSWFTIAEQDSVYQLTVSNQCQTDSFSVTSNVSELELGMDIHLCINEMINIEVPSIFNYYSWSSGDSTNQVSITDTGILSLLVEDSLGCLLLDYIEVTQSLSVDLGLDLEPCVGDTILISSNFDEGDFNWSTGDTIAQISSFSNSFITLEYTDLYDCVSTDSILIEFVDCDTLVSVINNRLLGFNVFPNPVKDYLFVSNLQNDNQYYSFQIFDTLGQVLIDNKLSNSDVKIDIRDFQKGIYFLQIEKNKKIETHKILIL